MTRPSPVLSPASLAALVSILLAPAFTLAAQNQSSSQQGPAWLASSRETLAKEAHVQPPAEILRLVDVPWHLNVALTQASPTRKHFLYEQAEEFPGIAVYGKPHTYFAGL